MIWKPRRSSFPSVSDECLRQAAGLIELDVDRVVAVAQACKIAGMMDALVGADEDRAHHAGKHFVPASGQRLLDEGDIHLGGDAQVMFQRFLGPALVGIEDDGAVRRGFAHGAYAAFIVAGANLDLE